MSAHAQCGWCNNAWAVGQSQRSKSTSLGARSQERARCLIRVETWEGMAGQRRWRRSPRPVCGRGRTTVTPSKWRLTTLTRWRQSLTSLSLTHTHNTHTVTHTYSLVQERGCVDGARSLLCLPRETAQSTQPLH